MTFKQQNRPIPPIIPQPALFLIVIFLLSMANNVFAVGTTPFEDDFDSYYIGDLVPQGDWATSTSPSSSLSPQVTTTDYHSAPNSMWWQAKRYSAYKHGTEIAIGEWSFWAKIKAGLGNNTRTVQVVLTETGFSDLFTLRFSCVDNNCETSELISIQTYIKTSGFVEIGQIPLNTWTSFQIQWDASTDLFRWKVGTGSWSDWLQPFTNFSYIKGFFVQGGYYSDPTFEIYLDDISSSPFSSIEITSPTTESSRSAEFYLQGNFNIKSEDWDRIMVIFEQWHASSTCPEYQSEDWETEYANGWFINQSMPFFSDFFSTSTGNFSILIDDLRTGEYNCTRCYFINETEATISSEKCPMYALTITEITPPTAEFYYPFLTWQTYYTTSSEEFATSTPLFENMANALTPVVNKMGDFILYAKEYFDLSQAMAKGNELGQAIPKARGYLEMIDDFIGLPLSSFVIFYFLTMAVVISYKVILTIIKLLKP